MKKLYEQSERERQLSQSLQAEKCKLEAQVQRLNAKLSEADSQVKELLDDLDNAKDSKANMEQEIYDMPAIRKLPTMNFSTQRDNTSSLQAVFRKAM